MPLESQEHPEVRTILDFTPLLLQCTCEAVLRPKAFVAHECGKVSSNRPFPHVTDGKNAIDFVGEPTLCQKPQNRHKNHPGQHSEAV